jgi:hypothetical protein
MAKMFPIHFCFGFAETEMNGKQKRYFHAAAGETALAARASLAAGETAFAARASLAAGETALAARASLAAGETALAARASLAAGETALAARARHTGRAGRDRRIYAKD